MEEKEDIFADLLSGLRPTAPPEPPRESYVSMEESRRKAASDTDLDSIPVRRSDSPVGENLVPPPPPVSKEEMQQLIDENIRDLLFQNFSALTHTLRTALDRLGDKIATVEERQTELKANVDTLLEKQRGDSRSSAESFRHVEASLKEVSVGIQRMLEKQDLTDAHVLLNRHAREQQEEKQNKEETEKNKKSEKRMTVVQKERSEDIPEEELEEEEEQEEVDPPPIRAAPKRKQQPRPQPPPRNYAPEPNASPVEPESYVQETKTVVKHAATPPVYASTQPAQIPRPSIPASYVPEAAQLQQSPPPLQQLHQPPPVQQQMSHPRPSPVQQAMSHPRPPPNQLAPMQPPQQPTPMQPPQQPASMQPLQQPASMQPLQQPASMQPLQQPASMQPLQQPASMQPPQQPAPMQPPQQSSFPPPSETTEYKSTPQPQPAYDYARHGLGNPNGYAPPPAEKPSQTPPPPYPQHMPPSSAAPFGVFPPSLLPAQQPAMPPIHPGPPAPYSGYPSLAGQQSYRSEQPPPPPLPHQTIYGSPAAIQASSTKPNQRTPDPMRVAPQSVPLDQVITDVANMGFDRTKVRSVVTNMLDHGEAVDLNVVIDRLTNMR